MATDIIGGDLVVQGNLSAKAMTFPAGVLTDAGVAAGAGIKRTKVENTHHLRHQQAGAVAAVTEYLRTIRGTTADVVAVQATVPEAIATGTDRTVTVDLQRSTAGGAFATVLSAPVTFNNVSTLRATVSGTIASAGLVVGDHLRIVVTVAGSAGAQAQGLLVSVTLREDPS